MLETGRPATALDRLARGLADTLDSQDITAYIQALEAIIAEQQRELLSLKTRIEDIEELLG